jgi:hypothetical protein
MAENMRTLGMIRDIIAMSCFAEQLLGHGQGKEYEPTLRHIIDLSSRPADESLPAVQKIIKELKIPYTRFRKHLRQIYEDLVGTDEDKVQKKFKKAYYELCFHGFGQSVYWTVVELPHIPRIGEEFDVYYFHEYLGTSIFYVDSITHQLIGDEQVTRITLNHGTYNKYWHIRKDEAELKRELHWQDIIHEPDYVLQKKLGY